MNWRPGTRPTDRSGALTVQQQVLVPVYQVVRTNLDPGRHFSLASDARPAAPALRHSTFTPPCVHLARLRQRARSAQQRDDAHRAPARARAPLACQPCQSLSRPFTSQTPIVVIIAFTSAITAEITTALAHSSGPTGHRATSSPSRHP